MIFRGGGGPDPLFLLNSLLYCGLMHQKWVYSTTRVQRTLLKLIELGSKFNAVVFNCLFYFDLRFQSSYGRDGSCVETAFRENKVSWSRAQHSDSAGGESRTSSHSIPRLTLYHMTTDLYITSVASKPKAHNII